MVGVGGCRGGGQAGMRNKRTFFVITKLVPEERWMVNERSERKRIDREGRIARTYSHCRQNGHDKTDIPGEGRRKHRSASK